MVATTAAHERRGFVRHGARSWVDYFTFNTDHKVIGIQYMVLSFLFFIFGGILAELIRGLAPVRAEAESEQEQPV